MKRILSMLLIAVLAPVSYTHLRAFLQAHPNFTLEPLPTSFPEAVSYTHLLMNLKVIPALWVLKRGKWVRNITVEGSQV